MIDSMWNISNNSSTMQNHATESANNSPNWQQGQNCVPTMVAHLNRYGEDLKIWGMPAKIVTFLAIVDDVEIVSTKVNFKLHDETGSIRGMKWLDIETSYESPVKINSYARVYGTMRRQLNENYVLVLNIQPMKHLNELCAHLMEVTLLCLEAESFAIQAAQNQSSTMNNSSTANDNSSVSGRPSNSDLYGNLNDDQILIMDIISHGHPEDGAERNSIKSQVPTRLVPQVDAILEFLSSEGHIYTTRTDDHFKKL